MVHPDRVVDEAGFAKLPLIDPVYPLTEGLRPNQLRKAIDVALDRAAGPAGMAGRGVARAQCAFPRFAEALRSVHRPADAGGPRAGKPGLVAARLRRTARRPARAGAGARAHAPARRPRHRRRRPLARARSSPPCPMRSRPRSSARSPTSSPIWRSRNRMLRLLQGDVGSGKTVVALLAAATVIEAGRQAALMAPTEILARQHFKTIAPLAERRRHARRDPHRPRARRASARRFSARLAAGEIDLLVGTHALIQDDVAFHDLALAVVDEQHRFGVHQRLALARKGEAVDVLVLTRNADPAHAGADLFRRHGRLRAARKAGRPPADRHPRDADRAGSTR